MVQCVSNRDSIIYFIDILRQHAAEGLDILADTVLSPVLTTEEIDEIRSIITFQHSEFPAEVLSREAAQMAAYSGSPLGNSHHCPLEQLDGIQRDILMDFRDKFFFGGNCVLSAAGIDHDTFVKIASQKFALLPTTSRGGIQGRPRTASKYVGGLVQQERELKEPFVKLAFAFEAGDGWNDSSLVPMCVLQMLLGGGSSFSAGGPGKGVVACAAVTYPANTLTKSTSILRDVHAPVHSSIEPPALGRVRRGLHLRLQRIIHAGHRWSLCT